jgi:multicomponent Na+:H+ antiporter subunit F
MNGAAPANWSESILSGAVTVALVILSLAFVLIVVRIVRGPTLPDRILALDMLVAAVIGFIATIGVKTGFTLYVDIAIALGLVGFLSTVAFARFVLSRGRAGEEGKEAEAEGDAAGVRAPGAHHEGGPR